MTDLAPAPGIRRATTDDVGLLVELLTEAIALDNSLGPWLVPHVDTRRTVYSSYFQLVAEESLTRAWVDVTDGLDAVAIWCPLKWSGHGAVFANSGTATAGSLTAGISEVNDALRRYRPAGTAHHYLALLATHPDRQGAGLGTALLTHHHRYLDAEGIPAYAEVATRRGRTLYGRHGYARTGRVQLRDGLEIWPMWRYPSAPFGGSPEEGELVARTDTS